MERLAWPGLAPARQLTVVVEVLDGVHAEAGEGLDVRVAVVQRVDLLVDGPKVEQAVRKIELQPVEKWQSGTSHESLNNCLWPAPPIPRLTWKSRQTGVRQSAAMKHAMPEGDANEAASVTYGRRPVAQRKAKTFSKPTQMVMPQSDQKRL